MTRRARSIVQAVPLPVRGWNTRDQLADLPPFFAQRLNNLHAENGDLILRNGYVNFATHTADIGSLAVFRGADTTSLLAFVGGRAFDASSGSLVQVGLGFGGSDWRGVHFATLGAAVLVLSNGFDGVFTYDGSTLTEQTITGVPAAGIVGLSTHAQRLWGFEQGTLNAVYWADVQATAGAVARFPIYPRRGGSIAAIGSWTRDGGSGPDDYIVFVTTEGEAVVYAGTDPTSSGDFGLVGRYEMAPPLGGMKSVVQLRGTLLILTEAGLVSMDDVVAGQAEMLRVTDSIEPDFRARARLQQNSSVWQVLRDEEANRAVVIVPQPTGVPSEQWVFSFGEQSWCSWTGLPFTDWVMFNNKPHAVNGRTIVQITGHSDNGMPIIGDGLFAPSRFGQSVVKNFKRGRIHLQSDGAMGAGMEILTDFKEPLGSPPLRDIATSNSWIWGVTAWEDLQWNSAQRDIKRTYGLRGSGHVGAVRIGVSGNGAALRVRGATVSFSLGRTL